MQSTTLSFKEGASDKIYQANLEPRDGGWIVTFAYGRRGTTLNTGTKTPVPLPEEDARRIYDKLIQSKQAKGYCIGEEAAAYRTGNQRVTDIRPQLLNPVEGDALEELLLSNAFVMEPKHDGRRLLLLKTGDILTGINRRGIECGVPKPIAQAALAISGDFLIDGEAVGDVLHVFDLLEADHTNWRPRSYRDRCSRLADLLLEENTGTLRWVDKEFREVPKRHALQRLRNEGAEGVVFKRLSAPHTPGRPNSGGDQFKFKFVETASVIVQAVNAKRSVAIAVRHDGRLVPAGNVTIPPDQPVPPDGSIVEVRYLYAMPESGALFQPVYLGVRDDIAAAECTRDQLKFRREEVAA